MRSFASIIITLFSSALLLLAGCQDKTAPAKDVIQRFAGEGVPMELSLSMDKENGCDRFSYKVENGVLKLEGSSNMALCRAFYEYVRNMEAGINSWSGNRLELPSTLPDAPSVEKVSPFKHHYYFNVVTYGYTLCYWDWERCSKLDKSCSTDFLCDFITFLCSSLVTPDNGRSDNLTILIQHNKTMHLTGNTNALDIISSYALLLNNLFYSV